MKYLIAIGKTLLGVLGLVVLAYAYLNLPLEWRRHKDIKLGNSLIVNIQNHQNQHKKLPETEDFPLLKQLGFQEHKNIGWQPNYQKLNAEQFKIIFRDGYSPPYLMWDSQEKQWKYSAE